MDVARDVGALDLELLEHLKVIIPVMAKFRAISLLIKTHASVFALTLVLRLTGLPQLGRTVTEAAIS